MPAGRGGVEIVLTVLSRVADFATELTRTL